MRAFYLTFTRRGVSPRCLRERFIKIHYSVVLFPSEERKKGDLGIYNNEVNNTIVLQLRSLDLVVSRD